MTIVVRPIDDIHYGTKLGKESWPLNAVHNDLFRIICQLATFTIAGINSWTKLPFSRNLCSRTLEWAGLKFNVKDAISWTDRLLTRLRLRFVQVGPMHVEVGSFSVWLLQEYQN